MQKTLFIKLIVISIVSLLLLIPLGLVEGIVTERSSYRYEVALDIAQSWTGKQDVVGPILSVPYKRKITHKIWDKELEKYISHVQYQKALYHYLPDDLKINGYSSTQERYRGIYKVPVYSSKLDIMGSFDLSHDPATEDAAITMLWKEAFLSVEIADIRGIKSELKLLWNGKNSEFLPGTNLYFLKQGVNAKVGKSKLNRVKSNNFSFHLDLNGIESLRFSPIAKTTTIALRSSWPHPKFIGRFLPQKREISDEGFTADWSTTHFSTNMAARLTACNEGECVGFDQDLFGVAFVQPVDIYHQAERSIKYAILFILLTFVIFFIFEMRKRSPIHPIQYGLVGLGLAIFYLLLVSLSEHLAFGLAYFISSFACIALLSFYVNHVMKDRGRGLSFGAMLAFLYGILFTLIRLEDYALLMGTFLVFVTLAATMYFTRRINWYEAVENIPLSNKVGRNEL